MKDSFGTTRTRDDEVKVGDRLELKFPSGFGFRNSTPERLTDRDSVILSVGLLVTKTFGDLDPH